MKKSILLLTSLLVLSPITYAKSIVTPMNDSTTSHEAMSLNNSVPLSVNLHQLSKEQQSVYNTVIKYQTALNAGDTKTILSLYAPTSYSQWNNKRTADTQLKRYTQYSNLFKNEKFETDFAFDSIVVNGDNAYVRTHHHRGAVVTEKDNQHTLIDLNREVFLMKKIDNQWKISVYTFNTDPVQGES